MLSNFGVDERQSSAEQLFSGKMNINIKLERKNKIVQEKNIHRGRRYVCHIASLVLGTGSKSKLSGSGVTATFEYSAFSKFHYEVGSKFDTETND